MIRVFCGSRSLYMREGERIPEAENWAFEQIRTRLTKDDILVTGDAEGPDRWSLWVAREELGIPWYSYHKSGNIVTPQGERPWCEGRGTRPTGHDDHGVWRKWFLLRDAVMIEHVAKMRDKGREVAVVGLVDALTPTRGTDFTLEEARKYGLPVERLVFTQG